jgi:hypothetical protein
VNVQVAVADDKEHVDAVAADENLFQFFQSWTSLSLRYFLYILFFEHFSFLFTETSRTFKYKTYVMFLDLSNVNLTRCIPT